jgi:hypothetical protein
MATAYPDHRQEHVLGRWAIFYRNNPGPHAVEHRTMIPAPAQRPTIIDRTSA